MSNVYSKRQLYYSLECDEIDDFEEGFMSGYLNAYNVNEHKKKPF